MAQTKLGTPLTMAPELLNDKANYTSKADLWGIGVVFYQLLFGDPPFFALSIGELSLNIQKNSGPNLKLPTKINAVSQEVEDLLRKLLQADPANRISWNDFFCHVVFEDRNRAEDKKKVGQFLGNFLIKNASKMNVDKNFEQIRNHGYENPKPLDPLQLNIEKDTMKITEESTPNSKVNVMSEKMAAQETYKENAFRYFHEKNKILFIFLTVKQLRQVMKNVEFQQHAPAIYILILCLAKKGIILSELNVMSLKKGNNIFGLPQFESFIQTDNCAMAIKSLLEDQPSLFEYFNYLKNKTNEVTLNAQDTSMIQSLNEPYVYLPTLDQMSKSKYDELRGIAPPNALNENQTLRHDYLLVLVYTLYAIKSEPHFPYSEKGKKFEWETFRQRHENMNDVQLKALIDVLNQGH